MDIDSIVDQALAPEANAQPQVDAVTETVDKTKTEDVATNEPAEQEAGEDSETPWPKKAENALAREKGKSARYKFQAQQEREARAQLEARLSKLEQQSAPKTGQSANTGEPKETEFNNYADYLEAKNAHNIEKKFAERDSKHEETQRTAKEQAWEAQRLSFIDQKEMELAKEIPDISSLADEYIDVIRSFSPEIKRLFLEADNAPLAIYNLAKSGKLDELSDMSYARAAMEIGRAETQAPTKPKTKAPIPLSASRGSVASGKSLDTMSGHELLKWVKS